MKKLTIKWNNGRHRKVLAKRLKEGSSKEVSEVLSLLSDQLFVESYPTNLEKHKKWRNLSADIRDGLEKEGLGESDIETFLRLMLIAVREESKSNERDR